MDRCRVRCQGSQLGLILFLLFVNDMPNVVTSATLAMFECDSKCYKVTNHHSDYLHLQQDLDALSNWSLRNELFFQPTKCSNLRISRKRLSPPRSYVLNGINVEVVTAEKDLGIMIANDTFGKIIYGTLVNSCLKEERDNIASVL